jgi:hypothetical protein
MTIDNSPLAHEAHHKTRENPRRVQSFILAAFLGVVLTVVLAGAVVWLSTGLGLMQLVDSLRGGRTLIKVDQPTVVRQIQQLQRLETVSYTMDKIISGEHDNAYLPKFLSSALSTRASACIVEVRHMGHRWIGNYICAVGVAAESSSMDLERYAVPPPWLVAAYLFSRPDRWNGASPSIYV